MAELTFFEKLGILGTNILAHPIFILLLLSPALIFALNKKIKKKFVIAIYLVIIAAVLIVGGGTIFELLDNVIDGIFMVIYFPNFVTLFIIEVASAIMALITFLRKKMLKANKVINITAFAIIQTIFCLILTVVQVNDINVYEENALYANSDVLTLMQLLTGTFAIQIIAVIVFNAIEKVTQILDAKDEAGRKYHNIEKAKQLVKAIPEELFELEPIIEGSDMDWVAPLNQSLISKDKIKPISLTEAINEEPKVKEYATPSVLVSKPKIKEEPEILTFERQKTEKTPSRMAKTFINPAILKEASERTDKPLVKEALMPSKEKQPPKVTKETPKVAKAPESLVIDKPKVLPPVSPKAKPKELVTGLEILNLEKTIMAINNIQRIYTM